MALDKKKYYYTDQQMQLHEIRWLKLKLVSIICGSSLMALCLLLGINYLAHDILGIGYGRVSTLTEENRELQLQVTSLSSRMKELDQSLNRLSQQGNQLRLMVDLPEMDAATIAGGTGGAVASSEIRLTSDETARVLSSSVSMLQRLSSEMKVQQQSYVEIEKKYEYNKEYFSALPALKPMEGYYSPKGFGMRMHPVLGIFKTHQGLDIINDVGTPVYASGDGVIEMAGASGGGYGTVVAINHGFGFQTLYAHLSKVIVKEGQRVHRGDYIGKSGRTGLVSGPHLHYEVRQNGVCRNPADFFLDDLSAQQYTKSVASR